jgi:hypothetical protein
LPFAPGVPAYATGTIDDVPEFPPSAIQLATHPKQTCDVVGVYTGGGVWTVGVYRPSGTCRMRTRKNNPSFCFVCKYLIVDNIYPGQLAALDAQYPGG